ncbi:hypothetical protein HY933_02425 [Candidatus Falkowbacteria bacterium]|nr:hypothetical protein [Candidatus Falkowbacteria bacterium]
MYKQLLLIAWFLTMPSLAAAASDTTNNGATGDFFYPATLDNLALDISLKSSESYDKLLALTVKNNGTAGSIYEIAGLKLWQDSGAAGWQGWGVDTELGSASYFNGGWYFNNLDAIIPAEGLRVFVTLDTNRSIVTKRTVQLYIPVLEDAGTVGIFDVGDQGIFTMSKLNGPTVNSVMNEKVQAINTQTADIFKPEGFISNLKDGTTLGNTTSFTITGKARDQGRGHVSAVQLSVTQGANQQQWFSATSTGSDFATWEYKIQNIIPGNYHFSIEVRDDSGNTTGEINSMFVKVAEPARPNQPTTPALGEGVLARQANGSPVYLIQNGKKRLIDLVTIFDSWGYDWADVVNADISAYPDGTPLGFRDGYLIKADNDSKVYVIAGGSRYWIPTAAVFEDLGYRWHQIKVVSAEFVARHPDGGSWTKSYVHPDGTLFKYQTYPKVYLLENNTRRWIINEATFLGRGYKWENIITLPDWEGYSLGADITL